MNTGDNFEEYLISKKIDSGIFRTSEPEVWKTWKKEFDEMHPNSFTVQKLNLINPIRRKYRLTIAAEEKKLTDVHSDPSPPKTQPPRPAIKPGKPVIRPKTD